MCKRKYNILNENISLNDEITVIVAIDSFGKDPKI